MKIYEHFKYVRDYEYKKFFIEKTKQHFRPLKEKWFWLYVVPITTIVFFIVVYFEHVK